MGAFDDIELMEQALLDKVQLVVPEYEVKPFPQDGILKTIHPQGTAAVRFAALQPGETQTRQTDRLPWTFEINIATRWLRTGDQNIGVYRVLTRLLRAFHGVSLMLADGGAVDTNVGLIDLVTVEDGIWQYVVSINIVAPYIAGYSS